MASDNSNQENSEAPRNEGPAQEHTGQPEAKLLSPATELDSPHPPACSNTPHKKHRDWHDYTTLVLEIIGVLGLFTYTTFAALQWCAANRANEIAAANFQRDERAWMAFKFMEGGITFTLQKSFLVPTQLVNTGKTPAKNVRGNIVVDVFRKGEPLNFTYTAGHAHYAIQAGTIFPSGGITESFEAIKHGQDKAEPIIFTVPLKDELFNAQAFLVVHGRIEYRDIFGAEHWTTYCRYVLHPELISSECTRYNNTDDN